MRPNPQRQEHQGVDLNGLADDPDDHHVCRLAIASGAAYLFTHDRDYLRPARR